MKQCIRKNFSIPNVSGEKVRIGNRNYIITAHKPREAEQLIYQLNFITPLAKFVTLASRNQLARGLCFISHDKLVWGLREKEEGEEKEESPTGFIFPLGFDLIDQDVVAKKIESTKEIAEDARETFRSLFEAMGEAFKTSLLRTVQDQMRAVKKSRTRKPSLPDLLEKWQDQMSRLISKEMDSRRSAIERLDRITEVQRLTPDQVYRTMAINEVLGYLGKEYDDYQKIYDHLRESSNFKKPQELHDVFKKLSQEEILYGSILNSVCMNPECSYSAIHYGTIPFEERCPLCHSIVLAFYNCKLDEHINSAWELTLLQEMILAYILDEQEWVKRVWLHKAITQRKNGKYSDSVWVDLIVQTAEDKIIFIDVTVQNDLSNVIKDLQKKWNKFSGSGVDFDGFLCVSSSMPLPQYIKPVGETCLFGASHLGKIYSFIEYIYNNEIKKKNSST